MKKLKRSYIAAALVAASGIAIWGYLHSRRHAAYQTALVARGNVISTISATSNLNAVVTVQVGSQVSGNIKALYADFNTKVKKGQLVALIDPALFQARVQQVQASLESARAAVVNAEAQMSRAEADIATAKANAQNQKANISRAQVGVMDSKTKLERRLLLFKEGIIGREERDTMQAQSDTAQAEFEAAQAQYDAALRNIDAAEAQKRVAETQFSSAKAQVKQSQATLEQAQVDLDHTRITAPVDGTVVARRMDVGQTVAASFQAPTIFEIAQDLTKMQVDTNVDESDIGRVKVGQRATFNVDAYPGTSFPSLVAQIRQAPINTQNVITYDVVVAVDNGALKLFPGMTANVRILADQQRDVLKIPNAAFRFRPVVDPNTVHAASRVAGGSHGKQEIYVLGDDGNPRAVPVQAGLTDGNFTAITGGDLREGMRVVLGAAANSKAAPATTAARPRGPGF